MSKVIICVQCVRELNDIYLEVDPAHMPVGISLKVVEESKLARTTKIYSLGPPRSPTIESCPFCKQPTSRR